MTKPCIGCSKIIEPKDNRNKFCSIRCAALYRWRITPKKIRQPTYKHICQECKNQFLSFYNRRKYCSIQCNGKSKRGNLYSYKTGRTNDRRNGYMFLSIRENINHKGRYIREHRYLIEQKIGRKLNSEEIIHHIDFNPQNNNLSNLYLCANRSEHLKLHKSLEYLALELLKIGMIEFKDGKYLIVLDKVINNG